MDANGDYEDVKVTFEATDECGNAHTYDCLLLPFENALAASAQKELDVFFNYASCEYIKPSDSEREYSEFSGSDGIKEFKDHDDKYRKGKTTPMSGYEVFRE